MAHIASSQFRNGTLVWLGQRAKDALILAAGVALALPLILPFA